MLCFRVLFKFLDQRESIILNEAAVQYFGLQDPIGKQLPGKDFGPHRIIGVTENFHFSLF